MVICVKSLFSRLFHWLRCRIIGILIFFFLILTIIQKIIRTFAPEFRIMLAPMPKDWYPAEEGWVAGSDMMKAFTSATFKTDWNLVNSQL